MVWSRTFAVVGTNAVYALIHIRKMHGDLPTVLELGGLFLLGIVLSLAYFRTKHLGLPIGLHAALAYGIRVHKLLITPTHAYPPWLTGSGRLINGLMGWLVLAVIAVILLRWIKAAPRHEAVEGPKAPEPSQAIEEPEPVMSGVP
jgi:membrane protease YdiL (CAAX protease family)